MRMKVLLIEDNLANAETFTRMLNLLGDTEIIHTLNGLDGLRQARSSPFDVILIDFDLPDLHGTQVGLTLATLIQQGRMKTTPLVALTAQSDRISQMLAEQMGFDAFVGKPCLEDDLIRVVRQLTAMPMA
jgi:CheY-like chemotaxis protein